MSRSSAFLIGYVCGAVVAAIIAELLILHGVRP